jgi:hypothetical protein
MSILYDVATVAGKATAQLVYGECHLQPVNWNAINFAVKNYHI